MDKLKSMKETLVSCVQGQLCHLDTVDAKELGEVVDMIKDLEEAMYYCTITKSMEEKEKEVEHHYYTEYRYPDSYRDMDKRYGRMYYPNDEEMMYYNGNSSSNGGSSSSSGGGRNGRGGNQGGSGGNNARGGGSRGFEEMPLELMRDQREGRSPMSRKSYMESKEMHQDKTVQMKELEKYMQELSKDITEMIHDASPEEKQMLQQRISALATKIQ